MEIFTENNKQILDKENYIKSFQDKTIFDDGGVPEDVIVFDGAEDKNSFIVKKAYYYGKEIYDRDYSIIINGKYINNIDVDNKTLESLILEITLIKNILEKIGEIAFGHCKSLSYIELPDSLKTTGDEIFRDCKNLVGVKLPDKVEDIGRYIFEGSGIKRIGLFGKVITDKDLIENIKTSYHFIQYAAENGKFIPKYNKIHYTSICCISNNINVYINGAYDVELSASVVFIKKSTFLLKITCFTKV